MLAWSHGSEYLFCGLPHLLHLHDIIFNFQKYPIMFTIVILHTPVTVAYLCTCTYYRFPRFPEYLFCYYMYMYISLSYFYDKKVWIDFISVNKIPVCLSDGPIWYTLYVKVVSKNVRWSGHVY